MSWNNPQALQMAQWNGTSQYVTRRQLQSTIGAFYNFSTNTIDLCGNQVINITFAELSSIGFTFSPNVNLNLTVDLGLGDALGGALAGAGAAIGGAFIGLGEIVAAPFKLATGVIGLFTPRNSTFIAYNTFETINGTSQLQFSTLGSLGDGITYSTIFRTTDAATPNEEFGEEIFVSSFFKGGTKCVRTVGDPLYLAAASTINSSIQAFGQWVPILDTDQILNSRQLRADYNFYTDDYGLLLSSGTNYTYSTVQSTNTLSSYSNAFTAVNTSGYYFLDEGVLPVPVSPTTVTAPFLANKPAGSWYVGSVPGSNNFYKAILPAAPSGSNLNFDLFGSSDSLYVVFPNILDISGTFLPSPVSGSTVDIPFGAAVNIAWNPSTATVTNLITPPLQESTIITATTSLITDSYETVLSTSNQFYNTFTSPHPTSTFSSTFTYDVSENFVSSFAEYFSTVGSTLTWTAPLDVSGVVIRLYGAGGGYVRYPVGGIGGAPGSGGYVTGAMYLTPGQDLYFVVGEKGTPGMAGHPDGGMPSYDGGGGGGATYMFADAAQSTILLVAGGGGGQGQVGAGSGALETEGGGGGGDPFMNYIGGNADFYYGGGYGGSDLSGGATSYSFDGTTGGFRQGGSGGAGDSRCGGGGGGYYGGGGGSSDAGGGWGGGGGGGYGDASTITSLGGTQGGGSAPQTDGLVAILYDTLYSSFTSTTTSTFTSTLGEFASTFNDYQELQGNLAIQVSTMAVGIGASTRKNKYQFEFYGSGYFDDQVTTSTVNASLVSTYLMNALIYSGNLLNVDASYISDLYGSTLWYDTGSFSTLNVLNLNAQALNVSSVVETTFSTTNAVLDMAEISTLYANNAYVSTLTGNTATFSTLTFSTAQITNNANFSSINTDIITFSTGTCVTNLNFSTILSNGGAPTQYDISKTFSVLSTTYNSVSSLQNNILSYNLTANISEQTPVIFGDAQQDIYYASQQNVGQWASTIIQFNGENQPGAINFYLPFNGTFDFGRIVSPNGYASQALYIYQNLNNVQEQVFAITDLANYSTFRLTMNGSGFTITPPPIAPYATANTNVFQISQDLNDVWISTSDRLNIVAGDVLISNQVNVPNLVTVNADTINLQANQITTVSSLTTTANIGTANIGLISTGAIAVPNLSSLTVSTGTINAFQISTTGLTVSTLISTNAFLSPATVTSNQTFQNPLYKNYPTDFVYQYQGNTAFQDLFKTNMGYGIMPGWTSSITYLVGEPPGSANSNILIQPGGVVEGNFSAVQPFSWYSSFMTADFSSANVRSIILSNPGVAGAQFQVSTVATTGFFNIINTDSSTTSGFPGLYQLTWNGGPLWSITTNTFVTPYAPLPQVGTVEIQQYPGSNVINLQGSGAGGAVSLALNGLAITQFTQTFGASAVGGVYGVASLTAPISPGGGVTYSFNLYNCYMTVQYINIDAEAAAINSYSIFPQSSGGANPIWQMNGQIRLNTFAPAGQQGVEWNTNILMIPKGYVLNNL